MAGGNYSGGNKSGIACEKTIATIGYIPPLPYLFKQRNNTTQFLTYSNKEINKGTTHHNSSPIPTKKKTEKVSLLEKVRNCGVVPLFEKVWKRWYVANSGNGLFTGYS